MPGCSTRRRATIGGKRNAEITSLAVMQTDPTTDAEVPVAASDILVAASPIVRTCSMSSPPAAVSCSVVPTRSKSVTPSSSSSAAT